MRPDFAIDTEAMAGAVTPRTKLVFLCNPNNPTGLMTTKKEFEDFLARIPETVLIVSDEAYCEFADSGDYPDTLEYLKAHRNLIVLRSFSKVMGLTCYKSSANFVMADVGRDADLVFGELLKKGIIVRPLKGQGVETGLRITVGLMEENRMLIQALKDIL